MICGIPDGRRMRCSQRSGLRMRSLISFEESAMFWNIIIIRDSSSTRSSIWKSIGRVPLHSSASSQSSSVNGVMIRRNRPPQGDMRFWRSLYRRTICGSQAQKISFSVRTMCGMTGKQVRQTAFSVRIVIHALTGENALTSRFFVNTFVWTRLFTFIRAAVGTCMMSMTSEKGRCVSLWITNEGTY